MNSTNKPIYDTADRETFEIVHTEEFKKYMTALCRLSSEYVSRIRVQFAEKAFEMYKNETIRTLVLAFGREYEKREKWRLQDFCHVAEYGSGNYEQPENALKDSSITKANEYGEAIKLLFGID